MYLVSAGRRTFRPWTHTSDDSSYMYQLSLECILILIIKKPTTPICGVVPPAWQVLSCLVIYLYVRTYVIYAGFKVEDTPRWVRTSGQNGTDSPWMSLNLCVMRRYYVSRGRGPGVIHTVCCCCCCCLNISKKADDANMWGRAPRLAGSLLSCYLCVRTYVRTYVIYAGFKVEDTPRWVRTSGLNGTDRPWMSLNLCVMRRYYVSRGRGPGVIHTICCCCFYIIISNFLPNIISSTPRLSVLPDSSSLERYNLCGQRQQ